MSHGRQSTIPQTAQVETALQLGTTVVRFYQYTSNLSSDNPRIPLTTANGRGTSDDVIQTLGQFIKELGARKLTVNGPLMCGELSNIVEDCKRDCDLVRDGIQAWLQLFQTGCTSRVGPGPSPSLSDILTKGNRCKIHLERQQRAIKELLNANEYAQMNPRLEQSLTNAYRAIMIGLRALIIDLSSKYGSLQSRRRDAVANHTLMLYHQITRFQEERNSGRTPITSEAILSLSAAVMKLYSESRQCARDIFVLHGIDYKHRPARHEGISPAHERTFEWLFDRSEQDTRQSHLLNWLRHGRGIFWVSGKPGSGKSTLMKYMAEHASTRTALQQWAADARKDLTIASHYFWYAGSDIQRSQEGLLRSLLCDIFQQAPELIPIACPERWDKSDTLIDRQETDIAPWTLAELQEAIDVIAQQPELKVNFCFFIDGLDEFSGQHLHICKSLLKLGASNNIKLCLSSRPWNIFEESFGRILEQKIYIHELTKEDIRKYVEDILCSHPRWQTLLLESKRSAALVNEVTIRAQGVFLWVFLVTRLLRDGLTNYDTLSDLHKRLDLLPSDLEPFFRHMMDSVEPFYHEKMSEMLQMAVKAGKPLPFAVCYFHDQEYEDSNYALKEPITLWGPEMLENIRNIVTRRLSARCMGLLEVNGDKIEFLHRTVYDFLLSRDMERFLETNTRKCFDPHLTMLQAYVAWTKHAPFYDLSVRDHSMLQTGESRLKSTLLEVFSSAHRVTSNKSSAVSSEVLLDELEKTVQRIFRTSWNDRPNKVSSKATALFRSCALQAVSQKYIVRKLEKNHGYFRDVGLDPLSPILCQTMSDDTEGDIWKPEQLELLRCLLRHGYDPNQKLSSEAAGSANELTPWAIFTQHLLPAHQLGDRLRNGAVQLHFRPLSRSQLTFRSPSRAVSQALHTGLLRMLLEFGADANVRVGSVGCRLPAWAYFFIMALLNLAEISQQLGELLSILDLLLSKADFSRQEDGLTEAVRGMLWNNKSADVFPTYAFRPLSKQQARKRMMEFICLRLDGLISIGRTGGSARSNPTAEATKIFMKHAAHPSLPMKPLESRLYRAFPCLVPAPKALSNPFLSDEPGSVVGKRPRSEYETLCHPPQHGSWRPSKVPRQR
ncbi:hypothetical protein CEP53_012557 [Fusarium sp. AF-6]|nr:hypothetical protein CEP53_012557 [Fusarium sp. AF-6]